MYGIDPSAETIAVARHPAARAHLDIDYRAAPIEALPPGEAHVDVVPTGHRGNPGNRAVLAR